MALTRLEPPLGRFPDQPEARRYPTLERWHTDVVRSVNQVRDTVNEILAGGGGGGTPAAHAPTHEPGGSDPLTVDAAAATGSLRTLGTGAQQAAPGNDARFTAAPQLHKTTHQTGGTDVVDVTLLGGYPGGTANFLRADGTFAAPPGGGGVTDAQYWVSTAHATLTAERDLGALASGYVKTAVSAGVATPSTVASIPAADGGTGVTTGLTVLNADNLSSGTVPAGRLTAANLPLHASRHQTGGADVLALDTLGATTDITTLNASSTKHGLLPKLSNVATQFLNGTGAWTVPATGTPGAHHTTHEPGGTDALLNAAWTNLSNTFTANQTIGAFAPSFFLKDTSAAANARFFDLHNEIGSFTIRAVDDTFATQTIPLALDRTGNATIGKNLTAGGVLTVSGFGAHSLSAGGTGVQGLTLAQTLDGAANYATLQLAAAGQGGGLYAFPPSFASAGANLAGSLAVVGGDSGGLSVQASHAAGAIRFYSGGATERLRINANGSLGVPQGSAICFGDLAGANPAYIFAAATNRIGLVAGGAVYYCDPAYFYPSADNVQSCGVASNRWTAVYAINGTIQTSDRAHKTAIGPSGLGLDFVLGLTPSEFSYQDEGAAVRRHGLIAQDVIAAAHGQSLTGIVIGEAGDYGLNYAGLVTPLVSAIQSHETRLAALEARLKDR